MASCKILCFIGIAVLLMENIGADRQREKVNCEEATQDKCENFLSWEEQCPKECEPHPNTCSFCRDKMYFCDDLKADSTACDDWEVKALCLKTCGECSCTKPRHEDL
ncbi:uncharacterized protein [Clytia hemisphaerica]|uniref:ShKT domain-containing protein n=1 Tax=Clytia hemisphaerica TaxID=252671 RepID=A0A7M5U894_9CNID